MAGRMAKNTTYNTEEIYSILRLCVQEAKDALKEGETVLVGKLFRFFVGDVALRLQVRFVADQKDHLKFRTRPKIGHDAIVIVLRF